MILTMPQPMSNYELEVAQLPGAGRRGLVRLLRNAGTDPDAARFVSALLEMAARLAEAHRKPAAMSSGEQAIWESVGAKSADADDVRRVELRGMVAMADLVEGSFQGDVLIAAELGVDRSRISQRVAERSLYFFTLSGEERFFPRWQVVGGKTLHGLRTVLADLDPNLHPLTVDNWFTTPSVDLVAEGELMSPVDWLATGGKPEALDDLIPPV
jgi:hypothetical protein